MALKPRDFTHTFSGAGSHTFFATGKYFRIIQATDDLQISVDDEPVITRKVGGGFNDETGFSKLKITSASGQSIRFVVADQQQDIGVPEILSGLTAVVAAANDNPALPKVTVSAGAAAQLCASNSTRSSVRISIPASAGGGVTLGEDNTISASKGGLLEEGTPEHFETKGAIWAYNNNAFSVDVYVMEFTL